MGIATRVRSSLGLRSDRGPADDFWYTPLTATSHSGVVVTPDAAMRVGAFYACLRVLSEDIGKIPLILHRRLKNGAKERATDHPLYPILRLRPNPRQSAFSWREMLQAHMAMRGNGFSFKVYDGNGNLQALLPLQPDRVKVEILSSERARYQVQQTDGTWRPYTQDEIFHVPGMSLDGVLGVSVIEYARETIGLASATEGYAARFFRNNARPGGVLKHPKNLSEDAQRRLKQSFSEEHAGIDRAWKLFVAEEGMEYEQVGMDLKDAQFIEQRDFQVPEIARWFRMPLHKIGYMKQATFSNIEHQAIEYVQDTLLSWLVRWEQAITLQLLDDPDEYFVEFETAALLRGDQQSRFTAYSIARQWGWLSVNEIRKKENEEPIGPQGDTYLEPLNMVPAGTQRDVQQGALEAAMTRRLTASALPMFAQMTAHESPAPAPSPAPAAQPDAVFRSLIADAAERIAKAEIREIAKRGEKATSDPARFGAWLAEFCDGQRSYVLKTIQPLADAWQLQTHYVVPAEQLADEVVATGKLLAHLTTDPVSIATWADRRPAAIAHLLTEAFRHA